MIRLPPRSPLFPSPTLFRSNPGQINQATPLQKPPSGSAANSNALSKRPPQASPQEIAATAENFERENSDSPGLLLLDSSWKPRSEEHTSELQSRLHLV